MNFFRQILSISLFNNVYFCLNPIKRIFISKYLLTIITISLFNSSYASSICDENFSKFVNHHFELTKEIHRPKAKASDQIVNASIAQVRKLNKFALGHEAIQKINNLLNLKKNPRILMAANEFGTLTLGGKSVTAKVGGTAVVVNDMVKLFPDFIKRQAINGEVGFVFMGYEGMPKSGIYRGTFEVPMADRLERIDLFEETLESGAKIFVGHNHAFQTRSIIRKERDLYVGDPFRPFTDHQEWEHKGVYVTALYNKFIAQVHEWYGSNVYHPHDSHTFLAAGFMKNDTVIMPTIHNFGDGYQGNYWTNDYGNSRIPHPNYPYGIPGGDHVANDYLLSLLGVDFDTYMKVYERDANFVVGKVLSHIQEQNLIAGVPVSDGYAKEIAGEYGYMFDGLNNGLSIKNHASNHAMLRKKTPKGLKRININVTDPEVREMWLKGLRFGEDLVSQKGIASVHKKKAIIKAAVQKNAGLEINPDKPLFVTVGRLVHQKNIGVFAENIQKIVEQGGQVIIAGTKIDGDGFGEQLSKRIFDLQAMFPEQVKYYHQSTFDEISTFVQAGSDFFVINSKFEPCGLTDIEAAWLGSVVLARRTGGLGKVKNGLYYDWLNTADYGGEIGQFGRLVDLAIDMYKNNHSEFLTRRIGGMKENFSWDISFEGYWNNYISASVHKVMAELHHNARGGEISFPKAIDAAQAVVDLLTDPQRRNYIRLLKKRSKHTIIEREIIERFENFGKHYGVRGDNVQKTLGVTLNKKGASFRIFAPGLDRVEVITERFGWDAPITMQELDNGVWDVFVPGMKNKDKYKYKLHQGDGVITERTDPVSDFVSQGEDGVYWRNRDGKSWHSVIFKSKFEWTDKQFKLPQRPRMMEVHPGTIIPGNDGANWRDIAEYLIPRLKRSNINMVQLTPVSHHNVHESWGYQLGSFFSTNFRHGNPDDLKYLINKLHENDIAVSFDIVLGHFSKDTDTGVASMGRGGSALFEKPGHMGEHPHWGTKIFNFDNPTTRSYLMSYGRSLIEEFHVDAYRVDGVSSMLRLDFGREYWEKPFDGTNIDHNAVRFLQDFNKMMHRLKPGVIAVAEESHSYPGVTKPMGQGGLGFDFKWEMGGMHHIRKFLKQNPADRNMHDLVAPIQWDSNPHVWNENQIHYVNNHDEVSNPGKYFLDAIEGLRHEDEQFDWGRMINAHISFNVPGRPLHFMGDEFANKGDLTKSGWAHWWNHETYLNVHLRDSGNPKHKMHERCFERMGKVLNDEPAFGRIDAASADVLLEDNGAKVVVVARYSEGAVADDTLVTVMNTSSTFHEKYRIPIPDDGEWEVILNTDKKIYGGSGSDVEVGEVEDATVYFSWKTHPKSLELDIPPRSFLILKKKQ